MFQFFYLSFFVHLHGSDQSATGSMFCILFLFLPGTIIRIFFCKTHSACNIGKHSTFSQIECHHYQYSAVLPCNNGCHFPTKAFVCLLLCNILLSSCPMFCSHCVTNQNKLSFPSNIKPILCSRILSSMHTVLFNYKHFFQR